MSFGFISSLNPFSRTNVTDIENQNNDVVMGAMPNIYFDNRPLFVEAGEPVALPLSRFWSAVQKCAGCMHGFKTWLTTPFDPGPPELAPRITTELENLKETWWQIHNGEDAEGKEEKNLKKLEPIGRNQFIALGATISASIALQFIFKHEPLMKGVSGASMGAIKISYFQMQPGTAPKYIMRAFALTTLAAAVIFYYVPDDPHGVLPVLRALPLADPAMAVFAKCDLASLKLDDNLVKVFKKIGFDLPKRAATIATCFTQALLATAMMNSPRLVGPFLAATGAVLSKANMRRIIDVVWQAIEKDLTSSRERKVAVWSALALLTGVAGVSVYALTTPLFQNPQLSWLPIVGGIIALDTLLRTAKQVVKSYELPDEFPDDYVPPASPPPTIWSRCWDTCGSAVKGLGLVAATVGIAAFVGPKMIKPPGSTSVSTNAGVIVALVQEAGSLLKVATNKLINDKLAFGVSLATLAVGSGIYLAKDVLGIDRYVTPGYGACLFGLSSIFTTAMYLDKMYLKAPKRPKIKKIEMQELQLLAPAE